MLYAIVSPEGVIQGYSAGSRECGKGWRCLPVVVAADPDADPAVAPAHNAAVETCGHADAVVGDVVERTWTVGARDVGATRAALVERVKAEAQRRIYAFAPAWRQANATARAVELLRIGEANWSAGDAADAAACTALWDRVRAVRTASDAIEAEVAALSAAAAAAFDVVASPLWPPGA